MRYRQSEFANRIRLPHDTFRRRSSLKSCQKNASREGHMIDRRRFITISSASAAAALVPASSVNAQIAGNAFVVSGFPPGGIGDLIARPMAEKMRGRYATNVLVDSKVGAGGRLAVEFVKRANPDGLTILQIPASIMTLYPHI